MREPRKEVKCVVWDLDNTLWEGTLLESDNIKLKPGIKEIIRELDSRGILHSIATKNTYEDVMQKLTEFGLDQYFLYPEIHWNAKSLSIAKIQKNLNIGMDTILFIDDQPFERDEVNAVHPSIECLDASEYVNLLSHPRLNPRFVTEDSKRRRLLYLEDMTRRQVEETYKGSPEEFLASLDMKFFISEAKEDDLKRAEELTVRTHQLNATGVTYDYDELDAFRTSDTHKLFVGELIDKYGPYGKIGLALAEISEIHWYLKLLLMSCRVMSRGVGTVLLSHIMQETKKDGKKLLADFKKTDRNRMMFITYRFANFKEIRTNGDGYTLLENDLTQIPKFPPYMKVKIR